MNYLLRARVDGVDGQINYLLYNADTLEFLERGFESVEAAEMELDDVDSLIVSDEDLDDQLECW